jgi:hypothetical protein
MINYKTLISSSDTPTSMAVNSGLLECLLRSADHTHRVRWFEHVQIMEENRIPKRAKYMNMETRRLRGRPRNRLQDEVREDGRVVGGRKKYITERNWKKLLRMARNHRILHMPME